MPFVLAMLSNLVVWLAGLVGKKVAIAVTVGATFVAGWVALQAALYALWTGLGYALPSIMVEPLGFAVYVVPDNATSCLTACMSGKIARWLWSQQVEWLKVTASAA